MIVLSKPAALACKRMFDITVAGGALTFLSPIIGLIALGIKLDDRGPVFFVQDRVGKGRKNFRCFKFRTMVIGAENIGNPSAVTQNRPMRVTSKPANDKRARDIDRDQTVSSLRRHEQCLERRNKTTSTSPWAARLVATAHRATHRCAPRDRGRLS